MRGHSSLLDPRTGMLMLGSATILSMVREESSHDDGGDLHGQDLCQEPPQWPYLPQAGHCDIRELLGGITFKTSGPNLHYPDPTRISSGSLQWYFILPEDIPLNALLFCGANRNIYQCHTCLST